MFKLWGAASNAVLLNLICIQKSATCFVKLVLNELNSNDVRFTTYEKTLQPYLLQDRFERQW